MGFGAHFQATISHEQLHFVDDADLVQTTMANTQSFQDVAVLMQQALTAWEGRLKATGGAIVPMHAAGDRCGMLMSATWLDNMVVRLGSCTERGVVVGQTFWRPVVSMARKWPVQPVSAMSVVGEEGPSGGDAVVELVVTIELLVGKTVGVVTGCLVWLGSPRPQAVIGVASTGAGGIVGGTTAAALPRGL
jgi:hypothetical protein